MATKKTTSETALLEQYRVALENASQQPKIAAAMSQLGYDAAKISEGITLLTQTREAYDNNKGEDDDSSEAYDAFATHKQKLAETYRMHRKKAKVVFHDDPVIAEKLDITGPIPKAYLNWLETVKKFYAVALMDADIRAALSSLKITGEDLNDAREAINELESARSGYLMEKGEAQDATKTKDAAFAQMDKWMRKFYAVARIALEDRPQLLEALSKQVKS